MAGIALSSALCAVLSGVAALLAMTTSSVEDLATRGLGDYWVLITEALQTPIVLAFWIPSVLVGCFMGFPFSVILLWPTKLPAFLIVVTVVAVTASALAARIAWPFAPVAGVTAGLTAMLLWRIAYEWKSSRPMRAGGPSARR